MAVTSGPSARFHFFFFCFLNKKPSHSLIDISPIDITHIMFIGKISQMEIQHNSNTFYEKSQYTYVLLYHIMTNLKIKCQKLHFRIMISFSKYFIIETVNKYPFTILVQTD